MTDDFRTRPIDPQSAERLAASALRLGLVDTDDPAVFDPWYRADARGFHDPAPTDDEVRRARAEVAYRRTTGVWDDSIAQPEMPVATVSSWPAQFTVPGRRSITGWAISSVSVAPTHRRRGIARAMLESELRTASALGVPIAALTVSEATIYGRYGFGPSAFVAGWSIDPRRATWIGPVPTGSVQFISSEALLGHGPPIVERARLDQVGDTERWTGRWREMLELDDPVKSRAPRVVSYVDEHGEAQGFAIYLLHEVEHPVPKRTLEVRHLISATDDAYAALWRFLLEQDLVGEVTAGLRPVDEPLLWQVRDGRAVRKTSEHDHLWSRILDVPAALAARAYSGANRLGVTRDGALQGGVVQDGALQGGVVQDGAVRGGVVRLGFAVSDPLGFTEGSYLLEIDPGGAGSVTAVNELPADVAALSLGVAELSSLYFGGVSAGTLARAGRLAELTPGSADAVDAAFLTPRAPWLSIWF